ncbi:hypothetical protein C8J57DRAFT_1714485 [Mycena rebaudengoi]|nr:hypothetical protein C8J57DRAFT_1714485 [Mycena rebaudengoi]
MADIATKIPSKPSLKPSCEKCQKRANQSGKGFSCCSSCKVSRYCSRECQTSHWKEHKFLCGTRVKHVKNEQDVKAQALLTNGPFVSQASLRKWYYDNVDIVDYAIAQELELYKGPTHTLWRTHAVVFSLTGGKKGTDVQSTEIKFSDAEAVSAIDLTRKDRLSIAPQHFHALGLGTRIIVVFLLNREDVLMLVESRDLPLGEEWAGMERDEMWRMHIRMRQMALQLTGGEAGEKSGGDTAETLA